jgi:hypothetical protein
MTEPGEHRPLGAGPSSPSPAPDGLARLRPRSLLSATIGALLVALLAAIAWALIKGILEFSGVLVVAALGGWAIGALLWQVRASPIVAAAIAALAWLAGLVLSWLVAMAMLPSSSRTFLERVESTPFVDWLAPQFGALELVGLVLYIGAALYGARPRS